jgi:sugar phosphate isomerase/epimerase
MKLSLTIQTAEVPIPVPVALLAGAFEEKLARAAYLGADGVELMSTDPAELDVDSIRASLLQHGLRVAAIGSGAVAYVTGLTLLHADQAQAERAETRLRRLIDFAAAVGSPLVTIGSFRGRLSSVGSGGRERLVAILRDAAQYAEVHGVRLAVEPLNRYETDVVLNAEEGLAFVDEVGHAALGLLLDTYHVNIEETSWTKPFQRVMAAGRLWHVHLGDNNRWPPGYGLIDFPAIVTTLHEIGYSDYLSAELLAKPDPDTAAVETLAYMHSLLDAER